jgi:uncharacterized membrane protein
VNGKAAITVLRGREEIERLWGSPESPTQNIKRANAAVAFGDAPGGRGTEIHVDLGRSAPDGGLGGIVQSLTSPLQLAKAKDDLRRFKQLVETGEIARSESTPQGESVMRKFRQRPAQPLKAQELQKVSS